MKLKKRRKEEKERCGKREGRRKAAATTNERTITEINDGMQLMAKLPSPRPSGERTLSDGYPRSITRNLITAMRLVCPSVRMFSSVRMTLSSCICSSPGPVGTESH